VRRRGSKEREVKTEQGAAGVDEHDDDRVQERRKEEGAGGGGGGGMA
jgi:hypothetical protein